MFNRLPSVLRQFSAAFICTLLLPAAFAQAPPGYYSTVNATNSATLRTTLHNVIDNHQRFPYTSGGTDTWDILKLADEDPNNSGRVLTVYKNASYAKETGGNSNYNREHTWPKSYGFPDDGGSNFPYTDCHQLYLADSAYNSSRSNHPFRNCNAGCTERTSDVNNGAGGGSGSYPGNSNWDDGAFTEGTWEVWMERRGDIARAQFYMDIRYEGGGSEPNLILTDNETLIDNSNTGNNESVAYMGMLSVLLQWHLDDPVDARELARNDVIYSFQGNRNPFVDHPEWVDCLFNNSCAPGDMTPPAVPTGLTASESSSLVMLDWNDNTEPDLAGYRVYRSVNNGGPYGEISSGVVALSAYNDSSVLNGTTYYYVVTAEDLSGNESNNSAQVFETPMGVGGRGGTGDPWINELHYDNAGTDTGEFVEVAGPAGLDLDQWTIEAYNGNGGGVYSTTNLTGVLVNQQECIGTRAFFITGLQNGAPDGVALIDPQGQVIEFLSYEGTMVATNGAASGMGSTNIGVSETNSTPIGDSLQLGGVGAASADFSWQTQQASTPGFPNMGQSFLGGCVMTLTPFCFGDGTAPAGCGLCPCGNGAMSGSSGGCLNSTGNFGTLVASGLPEISNDTLEFNITGANSSSLGVLLSGAVQLPNNVANPCPAGAGIPTPTYDGLRCIGQNILRHGNRGLSGGANNNPWGGPGAPNNGYAQQGGFIAGQTRHWQAIYRDNPALNCGRGLNSTNGVSLTWTP